MGGGRKGGEGGGKAMNQKSYAFRKKRGDQIRKEEIGVASIFGEKFLGGAWGDPQKYPQAKKNYWVRRNLSKHGSKVAIIGLVQQ